MKNYSVSDAEKLLDLKAYIIRYWEKEIPLIQGQKDLWGKKVYTDKDMQIFLRLKYLLYVRRFTIEGAREQLYREMTGGDQNLRSELSVIRSKLLDLYGLVAGKSDD